MPHHIFTATEILNKGLLAVGFDQKQLDRAGWKKNLSRFRANFVGHPRVYADLFHRLQTTENEEARVDCSVLGVEKTLNYFFMGIYLLAQYPTEERAKSVFSFNPNVLKHGTIPCFNFFCRYC